MEQYGVSFISAKALKPWANNLKCSQRIYGPPSSVVYIRVIVANEEGVCVGMSLGTYFILGLSDPKLRKQKYAQRV
jgi:hypothetical protein